MAKKSAASKGYRKTVKKKPFLTKKEIIALVVIVAVIALAIILFNLLYDDGYLSAREVQPGDVVTYASTQVRSRYAKLAEAGELEGFTREDETNENNPITSYIYSPDSEIDSISSISLSGSFFNASDLADSTLSYVSGSGEGSTLRASEKLEAEVQGYPAYIFSYSSNYYDETKDPDAAAAEPAEAEEPVETEAPAETEEPAETEAPAEAGEPAGEAEPAGDADEAEEPKPESNVYQQNLSCYVQFDDTHSLCLHVYRSGEDESFYLDDDEIVDYVLKYTSAFTMVPPTED